MYRYEFESNNKTFTRVNKTIARKAFVEGFDIAMCPSNLRPGTPWHPEYITSRKMRSDYIIDDIGAENDFTNLVNSFEWYNCTNAETGKRASFFVEKTAPTSR